MNFLRLSEQIPDEASSVQFLQQRGIKQAHRFCKNGHKMTLSLRLLWSDNKQVPFEQRKVNKTHM
jgi:hypothetical protein